MTLAVVALPGNEKLAGLIASHLSAETVRLETRQYPDGESYLRYEGAVAGREVILVCSLDRADEKFLRLIFAAATARDLGATRVGLIAPYLGYLRQDKKFHPGEGITARYFAKALSPSIDWLTTIDPHLHRIGNLDEVYSAPTTTLHAAPAIAEWVRANVDQPLLIGPDEESEQWVGQIAGAIGAPHVCLKKTRLGDRSVKVDLPDLGVWRDRTPVLADDIISSGRSMIAAADGLKETMPIKPVCVGVHAVFAKDAYEELKAAAQRVVTCNTIAHPSNEIDISELLAKSISV